MHLLLGPLVGRLIPCSLLWAHSFVYDSYSDASFSESLYGLRRRAVKIRAKKNDAPLKSRDGIELSGLEKRQRVLSVVFLVFCFCLLY